jgi:hypothetical protein
MNTGVILRCQHAFAHGVEQHSSEMGRSSRTASVSSSENRVAASIRLPVSPWPSTRDSGISLRGSFAVFAVKVQGFHGDQVHHALVIGLEPDGHLHGHGVVAQLLLELPDHAKGVGAAAVALVDEGDAGTL